MRKPLVTDQRRRDAAFLFLGDRVALESAAACLPDAALSGLWYLKNFVVDARTRHSLKSLEALTHQWERSVRRTNAVSSPIRIEIVRAVLAQIRREDAPAPAQQAEPERQPAARPKKALAPLNLSSVDVNLRDRILATRERAYYARFHPNPALRRVRETPQPSTAAAEAKLAAARRRALAVGIDRENEALKRAHPRQ